jgi:lysophospholipase L1-like esterase
MPTVLPLNRLRIVFATLVLGLAPLAWATGAATGPASRHWVGSWAASQQLVEPANSLSADDLRDATLRQIVHLSLGGTVIRLRLSNRFGTTPLHVIAAHVARPIAADSDKIAPETDKAVTFSGLQDVVIPAHADYVSDPLSFPANALSNVAITLHIEASPDGETGHPGSRATSYIAPGDLISAVDLPGAKTVDHWYFIEGIDVAGPPQGRAVAVLGDSITDGHAATTNANDRWTDVLAKRLQAAPSTKEVAVLNQGIGGNRLLNDGLGPNALARFDTDVIAQPGIRYLIVLEGINDIGMLTLQGDVSKTEHDALVQQIIAAYAQMIARAHTYGIEAIGATIMPFVGSAYYHPRPASEADRQAVNEWIRAPGHFDAVIDFDGVMRDPEHPDRLLPAYDSGDHLHPSPAGYAAMGNAVRLSLFESAPDGLSPFAISPDDLPAHGPLPKSDTWSSNESGFPAAKPPTGSSNGSANRENAVSQGTSRRDKKPSVFIFRKRIMTKNYLVYAVSRSDSMGCRGAPPGHRACGQSNFVASPFSGQTPSEPRGTSEGWSAARSPD